MDTRPNEHKSAEIMVNTNRLTVVPFMGADRDFNKIIVLTMFKENKWVKLGF